MCKSRPKNEITTFLVFYPFRKANNDTIEGNATGVVAKLTGSPRKSI